MANDRGRERLYLSQAELRVMDGPDVPPRIIGYAARFDSWSEPIHGQFKERIQRGAFSKTLQEADVRALVNHDSNYVLGRNKSGTLRMEEDDNGLRVEIDPPDTQWARDLMVSMRRGDISQMSFGFRTVKDSWSDDQSERTLKEVRLFDVSVVTYPAYTTTAASVRSESEFVSEVIHRFYEILKTSHPADEESRKHSEQLDSDPGITPEPVNDHSTGQAQSDGERANPIQGGDLALYRRRLRLLELSMRSEAHDYSGAYPEKR